MSRRRSFTKDKCEVLIKEGRGQGCGASYIPWLKVRDVPSKGLSFRVKGWKTSRRHELLSLAEYHYFLTLEWSLSVVDIREQFPLLPIDRTLAIADDLGIIHPADPKSKLPVVMTTDFLIDHQTNGKKSHSARSVKKSRDDLSSKRTIEKMEIERRFWKEQGVDFGIIVDQDIPNDFVKNIDWLHKAFWIDDMEEVNPSLISLVEDALYKKIASISQGVAKIALSLDEELGLSHGTCLWIVKHCIATRKWEVDLSHVINTRNPLHIVCRNTSNDQVKTA